MTKTKRYRGSRNPERDQEMSLLWRDGLSLRQIAANYGISYERVRQCIARYRG